VDEAKALLKALGMPTKQQNDNAAYTLLAFAGIGRRTPWAEAGAPRLTPHDVIQFARDKYRKAYAENTRETIRRQAIHQLVQGGVLARNPDDPGLATNSPRTHYALTDEALTVIRAYVGAGGGVVRIRALAREEVRVRVVGRRDVLHAERAVVLVEAAGRAPVLDLVLPRLPELRRKLEHELVGAERTAQGAVVVGVDHRREAGQPVQVERLDRRCAHPRVLLERQVDPEQRDRSAPGEARLRVGVRHLGLERDFSRLLCRRCGKDMIVAHSCKGRGICCSCAGRRMAANALRRKSCVLRLELGIRGAGRTSSGHSASG